MKPIFNFRKAGLLAMTATVLFTACKKDKDNTEKPPPPPGTAQIKKVTKDNNTLEFTYGTDGTVKSVAMNDDFTTGGNLTTFNVIYGADKKITELKGDDGSRFVAHYTGSVLSTSELYDGNDLVFTTRYEYENNTLKSIVSSVGAIDALKFAFTYDAAGNASRMSTWAYNNVTGQLVPAGHTDYVYDGKANPMYSHKTLLQLLLQNTPKNNLTKETEYDEQNVVTETNEYTYQYNNQNLPQSAAVKTTVPGQGSVTSTMQYTYQ